MRGWFLLLKEVPREAGLIWKTKDCLGYYKQLFRDSFNYLQENCPLTPLAARTISLPQIKIDQCYDLETQYWPLQTRPDSLSFWRCSPSSLTCLAKIGSLHFRKKNSCISEGAILYPGTALWYISLSFSLFSSGHVRTVFSPSRKAWQTQDREEIWGQRRGDSAQRSTVSVNG